jgi:hypothetical protein
MRRRRVCPLVRDPAEESDLQQWVKIYGRWYKSSSAVYDGNSKEKGGPEAAQSACIPKG